MFPILQQTKVIFVSNHTVATATVLCYGVMLLSGAATVLHCTQQESINT